MAKTLSISEVLQLAAQHSEAGNQATAERLYQQVLQAQPGNVTAREALNLPVDGGQQTGVDLFRAGAGKLIGLFERGEDGAASEAARSLIERHPQQPLPLVILGAILVRQGSVDEGVGQIKAALAIAPDYADGWIHLGMAHLEQADFEQALTNFDKAVEINSTESIAVQAERGRGRAFSGLNRFAEARSSFEKVLSRQPSDAVSRVALGRALRLLGEDKNSAIELRKVIEQQPEMALGYREFGESLASLGAYKEAVLNIRKAIQLTPDDSRAWLFLGSVLAKQGENEAATEAYRKSLELDPENAEAEFFVRAMDGESTGTVPESLVEKLFDSNAERFEADLVDGLHYRGPQRIVEMLDCALGQDARFTSAIDLGCGTGLAAGLLKDRVDFMAGVDLSANMLEVARKKGLYDQLLKAELVEALEQSGQQFDLAISCDVLVYVGALEQLFAALGKKLLPGGMLGLTTELLEDGQGYEIQASGRFAHSEDYMLATAQAAGFEVVEASQGRLRQGGGGWIAGGFYLFRQSAESAG